MSCICGSGKLSDDCCGAFIAGRARPRTAEQLMRSRFAAYATGAVDYVFMTFHPSTRRGVTKADIESWSKANDWHSLEIVRTERGADGDKDGIVEFKAYYNDVDGIARVHHEISAFRKELGKWFYVDGQGEGRNRE